MILTILGMVRLRRPIPVPTTFASKHASSTRVRRGRRRLPLVRIRRTTRSTTSIIIVVVIIVRVVDGNNITNHCIGLLIVF